MRIGVVGSRSFNDYRRLQEVLNKQCGFPTRKNTIISGGARGADSLAKRYAKSFKLAYEEFLPDWDKYGKSAGFRRNQHIVNASEIIVAFWDGKSRGTKDSIDKALQKGIPVLIVPFAAEGHNNE
jgi:hypothetical protein